MVEWLFLTVPWGCLRFVIVVFPDHTHLLFLITEKESNQYTIMMKQRKGSWLGPVVQLVVNPNADPGV